MHLQPITVWIALLSSQVERRPRGEQLRVDRRVACQNVPEPPRRLLARQKEKVSSPLYPLVDLTVESGAVLPTVSCTNLPAVPSTERHSEFPVVRGKCTNCCMSALSSAHSRVGAMTFESEQALNFFVLMHASEEDEAVV